MRAKQKIVHGRGPSNLNLGIFVCSFDVCRALWPFPFINYGKTEETLIRIEASKKRIIEILRSLFLLFLLFFYGNTSTFHLAISPGYLCRVLHDMPPLRLSLVVKICNFDTVEPWFFSFVAQDELFSKNKRQLKSKEGKTLERSNTDFLSLRRHATNPGVNDSMVNIIILQCKTKPNGYFMVN